MVEEKRKLPLLVATLATAQVDLSVSWGQAKVDQKFRRAKNYKSPQFIMQAIFSDFSQNQMI